MNRKSLVAVTFVIALALAIAEPTPVFLLFLICSVLALSLGYRFRQSFLAFLAAWLLYFPLGNLLGEAAGAPLGFLSSGVVVIVLGERLSFDSDLARVLEAPEGVDAEAERRSTRLKSVHARTLAWYAVLCAAVIGVSVPTAALLSYAPVLVTAAVLLMFVAYSYVRRWSRASQPAELGVEGEGKANVGPDRNEIKGQ